jgi:hypothetical protein
MFFVVYSMFSNILILTHMPMFTNSLLADIMGKVLFGSVAEWA